MTLQQRENIFQVVWSKAEDEDGNHTNTKGPTTALPKLKSVTKTWSNVENQTYTLGETVFLEGTNSYTGCNTTSCTVNTYTMESRTAKARMITVQEANQLGCKTNHKSCPIFLYNYMIDSATTGGTINGAGYGVWMLSTYTYESDHTLMIGHFGNISLTPSISSTRVNYINAVRAVIEIRK